MLAYMTEWLYNRVIDSILGGIPVRYHSYAALFVLILALIPVFSLADNDVSVQDTGWAVCLEDFMANADSSGKPRILFTARTTLSLTMRSQPSKESEALGGLKERERVYIFGFDQHWLFCWDDEVGIYYIARHNVDTIEPYNSNTSSYGVVQNRFVAVTANDTALRALPSEDAEVIETYPADTRMSIWHVVDGWAAVPYKRVVGYIYVGDIKELTPVAPTVDYAQDGDILAAFTTFYSIEESELNTGRMVNLQVGCDYIARTYQPGEAFDFNKIAGPYRRSRGYMPSPVLIDGTTVAGYGGGTCQVSTTLYNALLQLPEGMTILYRRPHGPGGAKYAPHGVDAAVGADTLNLEFRNDYPFPVYLDCTVQNGALCICIRKGSI